MPEILEVEAYRRLAEVTVGRVVAEVVAPDAWVLKEGVSPMQVVDALQGRRISAARRRGKLLLLDTDDGAGPTLGLRFGMTGRLFVDERDEVGPLEYGSRLALPAWDRFALRFVGGGELRLQDPRRLGGVLLDPDEDRLGPDALAARPAHVRLALAGSQAPLKARLMDQTRLAGLGNLLTDEVLWRAGLDPTRPAGSLTPAEHRRLHRHLQAVLAELGERGGSHTGDLQVARVRGGLCPRDGEPLRRDQVGGRTTYWCPRHQR